jgi:hypothetical protein
VSEPLDRGEFSEQFPPTNQVAEIKACIRACQILKKFGKKMSLTVKKILNLLTRSILFG